MLAGMRNRLPVALKRAQTFEDRVWSP